MSKISKIIISLIIVGQLSTVYFGYKKAKEIESQAVIAQNAARILHKQFTYVILWTNNVISHLKKQEQEINDLKKKVKYLEEKHGNPQ